MKSNICSMGLFALLVSWGVPALAQITFESGTTVTIEPGTTIDITGSLVNNGTINGKGTINVSSNYTNTGSLAITIGPTSATHTTLAVGGTSTISAGAFSVTTDGYSPSMGDNATIITSTSLSGTFINSGSNDWNANYDLPSTGDFSISYQSSLPVELVYFNGEVTSTEVVLTWKTASEFNNSGFYLQHSPEGEKWNDLFFIPGHGTSHEEQTYAYTDSRPLPGMNYYRLKQVDFDGAFEYFKIISVDFPHLPYKESLRLYPNPASQLVSIAFEADYSGEVVLDIFDFIGRRVKSKIFLLEETTFNKSIDLHGLAGGVYLVEIKTENLRMQEKLVIE